MNTINTINTEQLRNEINKTNASLFRVSFVKANGENRTMYCKTQIKRYLSKRPNKKVVKNVNQDIVRVFDCQSNRISLLSYQVLLSLLVIIRL